MKCCKCGKQPLLVREHIAYGSFCENCSVGVNDANRVEAGQKRVAADADYSAAFKSLFVPRPQR